MAERRTRHSDADEIGGRIASNKKDEILRRFRSLRMTGLCMCHSDPDEIGGRVYF